MFDICSNDDFITVLMNFKDAKPVRLVLARSVDAEATVSVSYCTRQIL